MDEYIGDILWSHRISLLNSVRRGHPRIFGINQLDRNALVERTATSPLYQ